MNVAMAQDKAYSFPGGTNQPSTLSRISASRRYRMWRWGDAARDLSRDPYHEIFVLVKKMSIPSPELLFRLWMKPDRLLNLCTEALQCYHLFLCCFRAPFRSDIAGRLGREPAIVPLLLSA
jgi:hypothetical protein